MPAMNYWYSHKMLGQSTGKSLHVLPDGAVATLATTDDHHNTCWDDMVFIGKFDSEDVRNVPIIPIINPGTQWPS